MKRLGMRVAFLTVGFVVLALAGAALLYAWAPAERLRGTWSYQPNGAEEPRKTGLAKPDFRNLDEVSGYVSLAILLSEDHRFAAHSGLDFEELAATLRRSLTRAESPRGASTITQQLVKNVFLDHGRRLDRKLVESLYSARVEQELEKDEILALYLDIIELGEGLYGVADAADFYFDLDVADLSLEQAAVLSSLLPDPQDRGALLRRTPSELIVYLEPRLYRLHRVLVALDRHQAPEPGEILSLPLAEIVASEPSPEKERVIRQRVRTSLSRVFSERYGPRNPYPFEL